jgi:hypothetical protein
VRLAALASGDLVRLAIKGRDLYGEVTEIKSGFVYFRPLCPAAGWHRATARQVVGHWRKVGRRHSGGDDDGHAAVALSREQLSLPGVHR